MAVSRGVWADGGHILLLAILLTGCHYSMNAPAPGAERRVWEDVSYLASDLLEGRALNTAGRDSATVHIMRRFQALGLSPAFQAECVGMPWCEPILTQHFPVHAVDRPMALWIRGTGVNVAGIVIGADERLRDEFVVVGAHYDHIGRWVSYSRDRPGMGIRRGADDNASGTAALLELARRLASDPPDRSVLFIAFDAEEIGLFGSRAFVDDPPVALDSVVAMINLDMVGRLRGNRLTIFGVASSPDFGTLLEQANDSVGLDLNRVGVVDDWPGIYSGAGDHIPFNLEGVPVLHFSTGLHGDYHTRRDRAERINIPGMLKVIDLAEAVARRIADRPVAISR